MTRFKIAGNYISSYKRKEMQHRNNLRVDYFMYEKKVRMFQRQLNIIAWL